MRKHLSKNYLECSKSYRAAVAALLTCAGKLFPNPNSVLLSKAIAKSPGDTFNLCRDKLTKMWEIETEGKKKGVIR